MKLKEIKNRRLNLFCSIYAYMQKNYKNNITLTDLSKEFNFCARAIEKLFDSFHTLNFKETLFKIRINEAKSILSSKRNVQLKEVANKSGFSSASNFCAAFKRYTGKTPLTWLNGGRE